MDESGIGMFVVGMIAGGLVVGFMATSYTEFYDYADLCPTILEQTHTAADSLAVFQKHEGCWEYVQRGQP